MSKSLGNTIYLSDATETVRQQVRGMYTDPNHLHVHQPGKVEGNPVFAYLDAFDADKAALEDLKRRYAAGGLGDVTVKNRLFEVLEAILQPIRSQREQYASDPAQVMRILGEGSEKRRARVADTLSKVREAMQLNYVFRNVG